MSEPRLIIGNYNTSSRSFAVWLALRRAGVPFALEALDLRDAAGLEAAGRISPIGRLPVLEVAGVAVWEPLAICEYAAEHCPELWPAAAETRARARAVAAEAVYELSDLLTFLPMDMTGRFTPPGKLLRGVQRDLDRLRELWEDCRAGAPEEGPFLFGRFSVADAVMAPIVSRLETHGIELGGVAEDYVRALSALPEYGEWAARAIAETEEEGEPAPPSAGPARTGETARPEPAPPPRPPAAPEASPAPPARSARPAPGARRLFGRPPAAAAERTPPPVAREPAPREKGRTTEPATAPPRPAERRERASPAPPPAVPGAERRPAAEAEPEAPPAPEREPTASVEAEEAAPAETVPAAVPAAEPAEPARPPSAEPVPAAPAGGAGGDPGPPPPKPSRPVSREPIVKPIGGGIRRRR